MTADPFSCRCTLTCTERATQEDMLCDTCRVPHMHYALPEAEHMTPLALAEPFVVTFHGE